jgi:DNA polymerase III subunit delta'
LEEPPEFAHIFLLTTNTGELLPTIRSRAVTFTLSALPVAELETYLSKHRPEWNLRQRALVARLSGGAIGKALHFDLAAYSAARKDAMTLLGTSLDTSDHSELFRMTEGYRAGAEGREKADQLLRAAYSILEDLLFLRSNAPQLVRNSDLLVDLQKMAAQIDFDWITRATRGLGQVESGMRRNLLRSLSLDAFATTMEP